MIESKFDQVIGWFLVALMWITVGLSFVALIDLINTNPGIVWYVWANVITACVLTTAVSVTYITWRYR